MGSSWLVIYGGFDAPGVFAGLIQISTFRRGPFSQIFQIATALRPWANVYGKQRAEGYNKGANFIGKRIAVSHGLWIGASDHRARARALALAGTSPWGLADVAQDVDSV